MSKIKYVSSSGLTHYDEKIKEVIDKVDTSTNTKVTQTPTSTDASYPLLLSPSGQTQETNTTSYFNSGVVLNPSTKTISADIDGNSATATKATQDGDGNVITDTYARQDEIGSTDISTIGNGTATGAISLLNSELANSGVGTVCGGKNLFNHYEYVPETGSKTQTRNGVTVSFNSDNALVINGTASADTTFYLGYKFFIPTENVRTHTKYLHGEWYDGDTWKGVRGAGGIIPAGFSKYSWHIILNAGDTFDNEIIPIMITKVEYPYGIPYEPYYYSNEQLFKYYAAISSIYGDTTVSMGRKSGTTVGENSFAFGNDVTASGYYSHAEGNSTTASESCSHAEGYKTIASGDRSHAEGNETIASGGCSHAEGLYTEALTNQHAQGHHNNTTNATDNSTTGTSTGTAFVIGNGTSDSKSNAFRVTGEGATIAKKAYSTSGADYAEYFEWEDGNPNSEDRRGLFVTTIGDKIKIANSNDWILGVVSALPSVIGNHDEEWMGRYILDDFGDFITETFEYKTEEIDKETGEEITVTKIGTKWKENPDYNPSKEYLPRAQRKEWDAIGLLGVLNVVDDGTCQVNSYCKCTDGGIATACEKGEGAYRVIKRVTDNIVKVVLK